MNITRVISTKWFGMVFDVLITPNYPLSAQLFVRVGKQALLLKTDRAHHGKRIYVVRKTERGKGDKGPRTGGSRERFASG